jgi:hypothetical protein
MHLRLLPRHHLGLLLQAICVWFAFWLAGLPAYYQQYSTVGIAVASILLSVAIGLSAIAVLRRGRPEARMRRAFWISFYYTVPFALLDALYCSWYLAHGVGFLSTYWYLTIFYFTPWLTFMPTAALLAQGPMPPVREERTG